MVVYNCEECEVDFHEEGRSVVFATVDSITVDRMVLRVRSRFMYGLYGNVVYRVHSDGSHVVQVVVYPSFAKRILRSIGYKLLRV